jgi:hypothetical protein
MFIDKEQYLEAIIEKNEKALSCRRFRVKDKLNHNAVYDDVLPDGTMFALMPDGRLNFSDDGTYRPSDFIIEFY